MAGWWLVAGLAGWWLGWWLVAGGWLVRVEVFGFDLAAPTLVPRALFLPSRLIYRQKIYSKSGHVDHVTKI